jgi:hypothetical protein
MCMCTVEQKSDQNLRWQRKQIENEDRDGKHEFTLTLNEPGLWFKW